MLTLLLIACNNDCNSIWVKDPEECAYQEIKAAFEASLTTQQTTPFEQALTQITDPTTHDLTLVRLAVAYPAQAGSLCSRVTIELAKEKCKQILGRPHLQDVKHAQ